MENNNEEVLKVILLKFTKLQKNNSKSTDLNYTTFKSLSNKKNFIVSNIFIFRKFRK